MEKVRIETAQNVSIDFEIAGIGDRLVAAIIDAVIVCGYCFLGMFILLPNGLSTRLSAMTFAVILFYAPIVFYDLICEVFLDGQSLGKKVMRIKVARLDGSSPSFGGYLMRWIIGLAEKYGTCGFVALVAYLIRGNGQRLGDLPVGTTVVRLRAPAALSETILVETADDYEVHFAEVAGLRDNDIDIIVQVLDHYRQQGQSWRSEQIVVKTAEQIERKMGLELDWDPLDFLKTVISDYNHLAAKES